MRKFFSHSLEIGIVGILLCVVLFSTNAFYELVIPLVEKSGLEGTAFFFIDELIYYSPFFLMFLFVVYMIAGNIYIRKSQVSLEKDAAKNLLKANGARQAALDDRVEFLKKDYYSNCPNCGSVRVEDEKECKYCGASLIIKKEE